MTLTDGMSGVFWGFAVAASLLSTMIVAVLLRWRTRLPQALPNERSLHAVPVSRVGGLAIWAGVLPALLLLLAHSPLAGVLWLAAWLLVTSVSLFDDMRGVHAAWRLAAHLCAALLCSMALLLGEPTALWPVYLPIGVLVLVWSANLYNFMDGSDGLAALMAVIGFTAYAIAAAGDMALVCAAIALAAIPPLLVNLPPARLFLGDVGAVPLGFLAGAFGLAGIISGRWPAWFPVLVFLPFVADATVTLLRRILRRERIWQAHRSHFYQQLHRAGAGHRGTLAVYGAWMAGTALTAVVALVWLPGYGLTALIAWCIVAAILFAGIDYHWRRLTRFSP